MITEQQLLDIYDLVFSSVHSDGFKISEIKTLLFDNDYWFLEKPKEFWKKDLIQYLNSIQYDKTQLNINPNILGIICFVCGGNDILHKEKEGRGLPPKDYVKKPGDNRRISWQGTWDIYNCKTCKNTWEELRR